MKKGETIKKIEKKKDKGISWYKKKADLIFSRWVRRRDADKCFTCGKILEPSQSQAGHYIPRDVLSVRYDENNVHCQCVGCNIFKKGNYPIYAQKLIYKYGIEEVHRLTKHYEDRHSDIKKYDRDFYKKIIEKYGQDKEILRKTQTKYKDVSRND